MKKKIKFLMFCLGLSIHSLMAQEKTKSSVAILNIDVVGEIKLSPEQAGNLIRMELEKLDTFEVLDRYETAQQLSKIKTEVKDCYSKSCLVNLGQNLTCKYMLSGTIEALGNSIFITLRLIDVPNSKIAKTSLMEFIRLEPEVTTMLKVTFNNMFNRANEEILLNKLTVKYDYENQLNNPNKSRIRLGGPRFGVVQTFGNEATIMRKSYEDGGFRLNPFMTQMGYQMELHYLNEKRVQVLLEFIGLLTGLEQKQFMPSLTILNGFRDSKTGWEFGFGFAFSVTREDYFVNDDNQVYRYEDWKKTPKAKTGTSEPAKYKQLDYRGTDALSTAFVVAFGKTFKSGRINLPVNTFIATSSDNVRVGINIGWNAKRD